MRRTKEQMALLIAMRRSKAIVVKKVLSEMIDIYSEKISNTESIFEQMILEAEKDNLQKKIDKLKTT
jgi:hypothetical protein